jgi:hypothetical protein
MGTYLLILSFLSVHSLPITSDIARSFYGLAIFTHTHKMRIIHSLTRPATHLSIPHFHHEFIHSPAEHSLTDAPLAVLCSETQLSST